MIKHIIFDLDGVLISSKDIHYESLNRALGKNFKIPYDEHLAIFDGLPTRRKLEILTERKGLETKNHSRIAKEKQKHTVDILKETIKPSAKFINLFEDLKSRGFKITCASRLSLFGWLDREFPNRSNTLPSQSGGHEHNSTYEIINVRDGNSI